MDKTTQARNISIFSMKRKNPFVRTTYILVGTLEFHPKMIAIIFYSCSLLVWFGAYGLQKDNKDGKSI